MRRAFTVIGMLVLLSACSRPPSDAPPHIPDSADADSTRPHYVPYSPRDLDSRHGAILFFAKTTDPFSVDHDHLLQSLYESGAVSVSTYRVDFGSATGARLKYGVIVEDTFILLDASGDRVGAFTHPSSDEISILVQGRVPVPSTP